MSRRHRSLLSLQIAALVALWTVVSACGSEPSRATEDVPAAQEHVAAASSQTPEPASPPSSASEPSPPVVIAQGSPVEIRDYLVEGQITVFDFMSEYCGPCRMFAPYLERLDRERDDLTVVKVDINRPGRRGIDWSSPVAQQYRLGQIPYFKVFDAEGQLIGDGPTAKPLVIQWINELGQPGG
jgi:thioredoxin 1